jgi:hypothetical protein
MSYTYLTAQQLAEKIQYDARTIRNQLKDSVLLKVFTTFALLVDAKFFLFGNALKLKCLNSQV